MAIAYDSAPSRGSRIELEYRGAAEPMTLTGKPMCALLRSIPDQTGNAKQSNRSAAHFQSMTDCITLQLTDNVSLICGKPKTSSASEVCLGNPAAWASRVSMAYTVGAILAYMIAGFIVDAVGRRVFIFLTFLGARVTTVITYALTHSVQGMMMVAPINGFFTLGCAYVSMAIYPTELFTSTVRSTAVSFIFNAARLVA